ncbi:MAG: LacI family DNA-binding transcriptional regulator [Muribaculaceae bacterium]|nr:LacI family DNA-binding transcriptional regulator [Muribaculaceae bacterium]
MKDIARLLGVSVSTVSRALQDHPGISKQRRELIKQFAREHHFRPNVVAETLRNSRHTPQKVIGVIMPEFVHYYFASVLTGIEQAASKRGYRIMVASSYEQAEREVSICDAFYRSQVCGIIVSQAKNTLNCDHFVRLTQDGVPLVFYDRICTAINAHRVVVDDYMGTRKAVSYLLEHGCRRIAFFGTSPNMEISINRYNGYRDALNQHGINIDENLIKLCDNRVVAEEITPTMMQMVNPPDAFFAVNDDTAVGILHAVKKLGYRVPDDISICGFSGGNQGQATSPALTSVEQDGLRVGQEAADILMGLVEGTLDRNRAQKRVVKTRLVIRGSTR